MSFFFVLLLLLLLLLLSFSVCGSVLGLSFLVSLIPSHGSDYFNLLDSLW